MMTKWICSLALLVALNSTALAKSPVDGRWEGLYSCGTQTGSAMVLTVSPKANRRGYEGVFEFQAGTVRGSYSVEGEVDQNGRFRLGPRKWIDKPENNYMMIGFSGRLLPDGSIEGTSPQCRPKGRFRAVRAGTTAGPVKEIPRTDPPDPASPEQSAWIEEMRIKIAGLFQARERNNHKWRVLYNEILFGRVKADVVERLIAEYDAAHSDVQADALLEEMASGPDRMSNGGIGRVVYVVTRAMTAKNWPKETVVRVQDAGRKRVAEIMRPELQAAAALATDLPSSLEGLKKARAALALIENHRQSLEHVIGTVDPEGLLEPLMARIAEIEANPSVAVELEAELAEARTAKDPREATEDVLFYALGQNSSASKLAHMIPEARKLAVIAAIVVTDLSNQDSGPTAAEIAAVGHKRMVDWNAQLAAWLEYCRAGKYGNNNLEAAACFRPLVLDAAGMNMEGRLTKIEKRGCRSEKPGRYICEFLVDMEISYIAGGPLSPDILDELHGKITPGVGYPGEVVAARFILNPSGPDKWVWESVQ